MGEDTVKRAEAAAKMLAHGDIRVAVAQVVCVFVAAWCILLAFVALLIIPSDGPWRLLAGVGLFALCLAGMATTAAVLLLLSNRDNPTVNAWRLVLARRGE